MSLYNLHYLEFMATSHDKFWSHPFENCALKLTKRYGIMVKNVQK